MFIGGALVEAVDPRPAASKPIEVGSATQSPSRALSVDGATYNATELAQDTAIMVDAGFSRAEAFATVRQFIGAGISPGIMSRMSFTASAIARGAGRDLLATAGEITNGVTRGYEACVNLDSNLHFLTSSQREQIRKEFDAAQADKARMNCFNALEARAELAGKDDQVIIATPPTRSGKLAK
jgi:hypothetical protein